MTVCREEHLGILNYDVETALYEFTLLRGYFVTHLLYVYCGV